MATLAQWIHVSAAVMGIGGIGFLLFVLFPSARVLSAQQRERIVTQVLGRFRWVTWAVFLLLIASGLYNVRLVWFAPWGRYWELLAIKIGLASLVFLIALVLTIPIRLFRGFRERREFWLTVAFTLAMIVILISAYLRRG